MGINNDDKIVLDQNKKIESSYKVERYVNVVKKSDGSVERIFHIGRYMLRVKGDGKESKEKPLKIEKSNLNVDTFDHTSINDNDRDADIRRLTDEEFESIFGSLSQAQQRKLSKMEARNARDAKIAQKQLDDLREKTRLAHLEEEKRKLRLIRENEIGVLDDSLTQKDEKTIRKLSEITRIGIESSYTDPKLQSGIHKESLEDLKGYQGKADDDALKNLQGRRIVIPKTYVPGDKQTDIEFDLDSVERIKANIDINDLKITEISKKDITEIESIDEKTRKAIELARQVASGEYKAESFKTADLENIEAKPYNPNNDPLNAKDVSKKKIDKKFGKLESKRSETQSLTDEQLSRYYEDEEKLRKELARRQKLQEKEEALYRKREEKEIKEKIAMERKAAILAAKEAEKAEKDRISLEQKLAKDAYYQSEEYLESINAKHEQKAQRKAEKQAEKQAKIDAKIASKEEREFKKLEQKSAEYDEYNKLVEKENAENYEDFSRNDEKSAYKDEEKEIMKQAKLEAKAARKRAKIEDTIDDDSDDELEPDINFSDDDKYDIKTAKMEAKLAKKQAKVEQKEAKKLAKSDAKEAKTSYLHSEDYLDNLEQKQKEKLEALEEKNKLKEEKRLLAEEKRQVKLEQKNGVSLSTDIITEDDTEQNEQVEGGFAEPKNQTKAEIKEAKKLAKMDEKLAKAALEAEIEAERKILEADRLKLEASKERENSESAEDETIDELKDLEEKSLDELKQIAKVFGIKKHNKLSREELLIAIKKKINRDDEITFDRVMSDSERTQKVANLRGGSRDILNDVGSRYKTTTIDRKIESVGIIADEEIRPLLGYSDEKIYKDHSDSYYRLVIRGIIEDEIVHSNIYSNKTTDLIKTYANEIQKIIKYRAKFKYFVVYDGTVDTYDHHFSCGTAFIPMKLTNDEIKTILKGKVKNSVDIETLFVTIYPITESKKRVIVISPDNPKLYGTAKVIHDELSKGSIKHIEDFVANYSDNYFINNSEYQGSRENE